MTFRNPSKVLTGLGLLVFQPSNAEVRFDPDSGDVSIAVIDTPLIRVFEELANVTAFELYSATSLDYPVSARFRGREVQFIVKRLLKDKNYILFDHGGRRGFTLWILEQGRGDLPRVSLAAAREAIVSARRRSSPLAADISSARRTASRVRSACSLSASARRVRLRSSSSRARASCSSICRSLAGHTLKWSPQLTITSVAFSRNWRPSIWSTTQSSYS